MVISSGGSVFSYMYSKKGSKIRKNLSVEVPNKGVDVGKLSLKTKRGSSAIRYLRVHAMTVSEKILKVSCDRDPLV